MHRSVAQMQVQAVAFFGNQNAFAGQRDAGAEGIGDIGKKDAFPDCGSLGAVHVLHVEHEFGKAFVEDTGLDFKGNLRALESIFEPGQRGLRSWREISAVDEREQPCGDNENGEDAKKGPHAQPAGAHGGDLAVGGEAAQSDENADQHAHRKRVGEGDWHGVEENFGDAGQRSAGADDEFEDASQIASEQNEGEDGGADEGVRDNFAEDVASQNPHGSQIPHCVRDFGCGLPPSLRSGSHPQSASTSRRM